MFGCESSSVTFKGSSRGKTVTEESGFAVVGLGYVGLPIALALARRFNHVLGFDISARRLSELRAGYDRNGETEKSEILRSSLVLTSVASDLCNVSFFVVTVPTPVDAFNRPDLGPLRDACRTIASVMGRRSVVVFESTCYPGLTRDFCRPLLEEVSGLTAGRDFKVGYS